jgi:hypothetical protein
MGEQLTHYMLDVVKNDRGPNWGDVDGDTQGIFIRSCPMASSLFEHVLVFIYP